jgi:dTDP-glucose pyrophosphorylase
LGSRFSKDGYKVPKPIIDLHGHPFFWWAVESVKASNQLASLSFIVLRVHIEDYQIDKRILAIYPDAKLIILDEVTKGAAETVWLGIQSLSFSNAPIGFLDCDHAFDIGCIDNVFSESETTYGALCYFNSQSSAYSYLIIDEKNDIIGTVEKQVASDRAIAGFYLFVNKAAFEEMYLNYVNTCPYNELFMSGVFDLLIKNGKKVNAIELKKHLSFGTPEELDQIVNLDSTDLPDWFLSSVSMR